MSLDVNVRDVKVKCRKYRNQGNATGLLKRSNGENIAIYLKGSELDKYLKRYGDHSDVELTLNDEKINALIIGVERDVLLHNAINIDLKEI